MKKIRVLVADDSALMRRTLKRIIESDPELELADAARDGEDAVAKARDLRPDVITMDINMPKLDGITALQMVLEEKICPVVMVSSLTQQGAVTTFECLELGAFDFVAKPDGTVSSEMGTVAVELVAKVKAASRQGVLERARLSRARRRPAAPLPAPSKRAGARHKAVAIGISTGGPATIMEVLPLIPPDIGASIFLVQHMPATFLTTFARRLDSQCPLKVVEAKAGMTVEPGVCYVGAGGMHLCVHQKPSGGLVLRTPTHPRTLFIPSVDVMMESVLSAFGKDTVGVLMTGIGNDGAEQMEAITRAGGHTIAESEETAVVFGMPQQAIARGGAKVVAPSYKIAGEILRAVQQEN
jgi:two-component system chemotaxis response regulator CheB